ncbi:hypothetical protein HanIR_Chr15g0736931 [Helianthus annuus]|nr:hypothetical protein HanIR_Chr15g0736931 [Helianthus annuus]
MSIALITALKSFKTNPTDVNSTPALDMVAPIDLLYRKVTNRTMPHGLFPLHPFL